MIILYISYHYWPPKFGGELRHSIERFESLVKRGHKVVVLTSGSPGFSNHEISNGIEIFRSPKVYTSKLGKGFRRLFFPLWVLQKIMSFDFDVLHLAGTGGVDPVTSNLGSMLVCQAAKRKGSKLVAVHSIADSERDAYSEKSFDQKLRKLYLNKMDAIVSVGPALQESVVKVFPQKAFEIDYGVRNEIFEPLPGHLRLLFREEMLLKKDDIVFCFLGTVGKRKGFDLLARAFADLAPSNPNWKLWVIGPRTLEENQNINLAEVAQVCLPLNSVIDKVHFFGRIDDRSRLIKLISVSDVFVSPTLKEGMPLAPMEAMAVGTPVIVSRIPGVTDLATIDNETGLFVIPGDVESLEKAMSKLANLPELRTQMGKDATKRINDYFGWEQHITKWENLYYWLSGMSRQ